MSENHDPIIADGETPEVAEETAGASAEGCPVVHGRVDPTQGDPNREWWPNRLNLKILAKNPPETDPYHGGLDYRAAFQTLDLAAVKADIAAVLTDSKEWWPADFGSYAGAVHPDGVARRGHLPPGRRPGRGRRRPAALRAAEQLAGQREPGQVPAAAVAGQEEVRQEALLGRPDRPGRQRGAGVDAASRPSASAAAGWTSRSRRRTCTGARRPSGSATERWSGDRQVRGAARRRHDGPHLRQPGGPERQRATSLAAARAHPRDVRPDGDERRGDRGADRRRPHLRQDPRRGPGRERRPRPRGRPDRGRRASAGSRPTAPARARTRSPAGSRSPGPTTRPGGTTSSSTSCSATSGSSSSPRRGAKQWRPKDNGGARPGARRVRRRQARAADAHHRPVAALRPDLRADLPALQGRPGGVLRRVRPRLVQADPPRHGPDRPLPRPGGPVRGADLAGPGAGGGPRAGRRRRHRRAQAARSSPPA